MATSTSTEALGAVATARPTHKDEVFRAWMCAAQYKGCAKGISTVNEERTSDGAPETATMFAACVNDFFEVTWDVLEVHRDYDVHFVVCAHPQLGPVFRCRRPMDTRTAFFGPRGTPFDPTTTIRIADATCPPHAHSPSPHRSISPPPLFPMQISFLTVVSGTFRRIRHRTVTRCEIPSTPATRRLCHLVAASVTLRGLNSACAAAAVPEKGLPYKETQGRKVANWGKTSPIRNTPFANFCVSLLKSFLSDVGTAIACLTAPPSHRDQFPHVSTARRVFAFHRHVSTVGLQRRAVDHLIRLAAAVDISAG
ncbi:hypothetical protein C8R43DRAFT_1111484 [Mycena crocata]|nr:hypothetical protein C8R43DRAFT_1111484 [Mycena crocata]